MNVLLTSYVGKMGWEAYAAHILGVLRQMWGTMAVIIFILIMMAMLVRLLQGTAAVSVGGSQVVATTLVALAGLVAMGLFAFLVVPALARAGVQAVAESAPSGAGPLTTFTNAVAMLLGAIGALRMLRAVVEGAVGVTVGGRASVSRAMIIVIETLAGMFLVSVIMPLISILSQGM